VTDLLLDTHVIVGIVDDGARGLDRGTRSIVEAAGASLFVSVGSLWEIAIKVRLGKLPMKASLEALPAALDDFGIAIVPIDERHVLAELDRQPLTRDPFDRLLLAQCQVEGMRLVTLDRALADHPLAMR
jgi:PIN domain nuclease of toxin-antitoxin system